MCTPPRVWEDQITCSEVWVLRGNDCANSLSGHHVTDLRRLRIGFSIIHPAAHVRVERKVVHLKQKLSGKGRRNRKLPQLEVTQANSAFRSRGKDNLNSRILCHSKSSKFT